MKPLNLKKPTLQQVNGPEVTPAENQGAKESAPLNEHSKELRALPQVKPEPPPPPSLTPSTGEVKPPEGFDEIFEMALKVRTGKPGMSDFWARMAQADALNRAALALERLNEFLGVYDNDEDPDADSPRLGDILLEVLIEAKKPSDAFEDS